MEKYRKWILWGLLSPFVILIILANLLFFYVEIFNKNFNASFFFVALILLGFLTLMKANKSTKEINGKIKKEQEKLQGIKPNFNKIDSECVDLIHKTTLHMFGIKEVSEKRTFHNTDFIKRALLEVDRCNSEREEVLSKIQDLKSNKQSLIAVSIGFYTALLAASGSILIAFAFSQ